MLPLLYCQRADRTELHIIWECTKWAAARDPHLANVHALAAKVSELPPFDKWPPCLKISGLLPEIEPPVNRQVEQHDLAFIQALHVMFMWVPAARKLRDQQTPKLFPTVCPQGRSAYRYHQLAPRGGGGGGAWGPLADDNDMRCALVDTL